jgi:hypothetical protein
MKIHKLQKLKVALNWPLVNKPLYRSNLRCTENKLACLLLKSFVGLVSGREREKANGLSLLDWVTSENWQKIP